MGKKDKKEEFLEAAGALNPKPEQVKDQKFSLPHGFFDPRDKIQVKYEMLRRVRILDAHDTAFLNEELVERTRLKYENARVIKEKTKVL